VLLGSACVKADRRTLLKYYKAYKLFQKAQILKNKNGQILKENFLKEQKHFSDFDKILYVLLRFFQNRPLKSSIFFNPLNQCFSTAGTRPGTGTWRPFYRDLK